MLRHELRAIERLKALEGDMVEEAIKDSNVFEILALEDIEKKVHGTLRRHVQAWEEAGAGRFVINVIKEGFKLNMKELPGSYEEKNNKSFDKEDVFGKEAIMKLVEMRVLKEVVKEEVSCINPLTVAINDRLKKRLCIDLSRYVNEFTEAKKFKIESTMQFLQVVQPGDYMYAFDLKAAYHQVPMFQPHWRYLGLSAVFKGIKKYFVFTCLPFGLNDAARALTKLLRFPLQTWREWGARSFLHLDDGIGAVAGQVRAQGLADKVRANLADFGLLTSDEKCSWTVSQELEWTGWRINTAEFMIYVPERKLVKAEQKLEELLKAVGKRIKVKTICSIVGLIISFGLAVGRAARFHTRFSTMEVARVVETQGWGAMVVLSGEVITELQFWKANLRRLNGQPIRKMAGVQVLRPKLLYSDAGGHMAGGAMIKDRMVVGDTVFQVNLTEVEVARSSTYRELRGIEEGLRALQVKITGRSIRWHCDNWAACKIVEFGSMKEDCHRVAIKINELIQELKIDFEIVWQSRETEEIRFADKVSKDFDFGDYRISGRDFQRLVIKYGGFRADYFASDYSFRMEPFYSRYLSEKSAGSDAFSQDWSKGFGFFPPPVGLVPRVLQKAREDRAQGVLLVPDWPGSMMMLEVRQTRQLVQEGAMRPWLECPSWFENSTFCGVPKFDMLVMRMRF